MKINSPRNEKVKFVQKLARRRYRLKERLYVAEGMRLIGEALLSGVDLHSVYVSSELLEQEAGNGVLAQVLSGRVVYEVPGSVFRKMSNTDSPQGILALVRMPDWTWEDCCRRVRSGVKGKGGGLPPLTVMVDGLQDPGNLGTIIRAAEALSAGGVILGDGSADPFNPKTVRATMGSIFRLPVCYNQSLPDLIPVIRERGFQVVAAVARGGKPIYEVDWSPPSVLVLGNEGSGISGEVLAITDAHATIPIYGETESLNVGMASSIILYEALRQRLSL